MSPRFTSAPVDEVVPQRKPRQPSQRALIQEQYQQALDDAILNKGEALVIELEPDEKPLTVRNRLNRAAEALGLENVKIRRRGGRIIAWHPDEAQQVEEAAAE